MPKATIIITGDKKVNRMLKRLSAKEGKAAVRKAARPALKPVLKQARANAPTDTGKLKRNTKIRALPRSRKHIGARVTSGSGKNDFTGEAFYGGFLEFGTKRMKERRWLRNAADSKRKEALAIYGKLLRKEIIERAKRAAK